MTLKEIQTLLRLSDERIEDWKHKEKALEKCPIAVLKNRQLTLYQRQCVMIALHLDITYHQAKDFVDKYKRSGE